MGWRSRIKRGLKRLVGRDEADEDDAPPPRPERDGDWVAVLPSGRLAEGQGLTVARDGEMIAVFRVVDGLYAIDDACVHEDGPLGEGQVDGTVVTCPYHDWRYELSTGNCLSHADRAVGCFAVREQDGWIQVGARRTESSAERGGFHDDGLEEVNLDGSTPDPS